MDPKQKTKERNLATAAPMSPELSLALQIVNRYVWWLAILIMLVVGFFSYYWFISVQINAVVDAASDNLPQKQDALNKLQATKEDLDSTVADFDRIKEAKADAILRLNELLPGRDEYGDLFSIIDQITAGSGLRLENMSIAFSDTGTSDAGPVRTLTQETQAPAETVTINSMTISMSVTGGSYEVFKNYLEVLERSIRLFDVKSLSFEGGSFGVSSEEGPSGTQFTIELVTYYK